MDFLMKRDYNFKRALQLLSTYQLRYDLTIPLEIFVHSVQWDHHADWK